MPNDWCGRPFPGPLVVLIGPPASGKSTWAREHFSVDQIVSLGYLRRAVSGDPNNQDATRFAVEARNVLVRGRMYFGLPTVVDATNAVREHRETVAKMRFMCPSAGEFVPAIAVIFDIPVEECLARNARRRGGRRVPDEFIVECAEAIERDLPVASTWIPPHFSTGLRIRPDGVYQMGGAAWRWEQALPWLATGKRLHDCPDFVGLDTQPVEALKEKP